MATVRPSGGAMQMAAVWEDRSVIGLATCIRRASQEWEPAVEAAIFDTIDPDEIEKMIVGFVAERFGFG